MWRQYNRGERRTSLQNKPIHDLIGMRSEVGVVGIIVVICTMELIMSKILFESKESKELSPHDTISPATTDGKVT